MSKDKLIKRVNSELNLIFNDNTLTPQERGERGEILVGDLVKYWVNSYPDFIFESSFIYPQGPILKSTNTVEEEPVTEADLLVVTPYNVFVIEIKTIYGKMKVNEDYTMEIVNQGDFRGNHEKKNFFRQNEMHCRHIYYHLHDILPNGDSSYIKPLIVMTGKMKVFDERNKSDKIRNPLVITNKLIPNLSRMDKPKDFLLDINRIRKRLDKIRVLDKQRLLNSQKFKE